MAICALLAVAGGTVAYAGSAERHKSDKTAGDAKIVAYATSTTSEALAEADCAHGKLATGGGALAIGSNRTVNTKGSDPLGNSSGRPAGWNADIRAQSAKAFKVLAVCSKHTDTTIRTKSFTIGDEASTTVACPSSARALGGGVFYANQALSGVLRIESDGPLDGTGILSNTHTGDVPRSWFVSLGNPTGPTQSLTAYVVCSRASKARLVVTPFEVDGSAPGGDRVGQVVPCPAGKRAFGGGVEPVSGDAGYISTGPLDSSLTVAGTKTGDVPRAWYASFEAFINTKESVKGLAVCG